MIYVRKINYYETDAMKIVHHSNYIRFLEEARLEFMNKIGLPYDKMEEEGILVPVIAVNCNYKNPAKFNDTIIIDVKIKEYTGVKLIMEYEIINKKTDMVVLTGTTKHCFTNINMKPISLRKVKPEMDKIILKHF